MTKAALPSPMASVGLSLQRPVHSTQKRRRLLTPCPASGLPTGAAGASGQPALTALARVWVMATSISSAPVLLLGEPQW